MTAYYLWDNEGIMYAIEVNDPKASKAERLRNNLKAISGTAQSKWCGA